LGLEVLVDPLADPVLVHRVLHGKLLHHTI
jgi:hypothetical protein